MIYIVTGVGNHLGLWDDLNGQPDVVVKTVTWKKTSFIPRALNVLLNKPFMKNILHTSYELKVNALTDYKIAPP